jgi:hypothetical protein
MRVVYYIGEWIFHGKYGDDEKRFWLTRGMVW